MLQLWQLRIGRCPHHRASAHGHGICLHRMRQAPADDRRGGGRRGQSAQNHAAGRRGVGRAADRRGGRMAVFAWRPTPTCTTAPTCDGASPGSADSRPPCSRASGSASSRTCAAPGHRALLRRGCTGGSVPEALMPTGCQQPSLHCSTKALDRETPTQP